MGSGVMIARLRRAWRLRHGARACGLAVLTALAVAAGCGSGRVVLPLTIDARTLAAPPSGRTLTTHEAAVRGIAAVVVKELGLPVPEHVTVYVYSTRRVFEQGLIHDGQVSPVRAAELSDFAIGVGKRRQLLLNEEGARPQGREWLRLLAHELAHVAQIELAQGEGRGEQWLAEGMAEWVAFTVLERLGQDTVAARRSTAVAGIRSHATLAGARLDLATLGTPRGFTVRHLREGALPTYQLAFLMADYLITHDGFPRVVDYFASFAASRDRQGNFRQTFGRSLDEFEREVMAYLHILTR